MERGRDGRFRRDAGGHGVSRKNANFSLQRRSRAREEPVVARSDVVASPAPRPKSWTWIVKTEKKEKDGGRRRAQAACERVGRREGSRTTEVKQPYERNSREKFALYAPYNAAGRGLHRGWCERGERRGKEKKKKREKVREREDSMGRFS